MAGAGLALLGASLLLGLSWGDALHWRGALLSLFAAVFYSGYLLLMSVVRRTGDAVPALLLASLGATAALAAYTQVRGDPLVGFPAHAWAAFAGRVGMDVVFSVLVPGSMALSGTTFTTDLIWDTPTPELARLNEQKLRDMGLDDKVVRAMMNNPWYSLSVLTVFVNALEQLQGVKGHEDVAKLAASATSEDQARFITESLQMLAHYHKTITPVSSVAGSGPVVARDSNGAVVVPAPVDYVAWTPRVAEFARRSDLKTQQRGVWLTGELSPRARREFTAAGWTIHEGVRWSMRQAGTQ